MTKDMEIKYLKRRIEELEQSKTSDELYYKAIINHYESIIRRLVNDEELSTGQLNTVAMSIKKVNNDDDFYY